MKKEITGNRATFTIDENTDSVEYPLYLQGLEIDLRGLLSLPATARIKTLRRENNLWYLDFELTPRDDAR